MILTLIAEAVRCGARLVNACAVIGLCLRTVLRWRAEQDSDDRRSGPRSSPAHKLTEAERKRILEIAASPEFRDLSPKQIVPRLADRGIYVASESSFYRVLHEAGQMAHREPSRPRSHGKPKEHVATGPNQVWTWDITYLRGPVRGTFFYLYLAVDIFSRKVVAAEVHAEESMDLAATLVEAACKREGVDPKKLVLHADNGGPMKGSTMLATLQRLGVVPSFSRPRVSDDNPYVEALFRTLKFRPGYPRKPFVSLEAAAAWVRQFVEWYNCEHLHSALRFVTPSNRHDGLDAAILASRRVVYGRAKACTPRRWSRDIRNWTPIGSVFLNPSNRVPGGATLH